ncbi:GNAT family N-acetyltransferase [Natronoglomus mannanivorans]|uniref:GNAT family N-acetyltransferase n=1 Tax=Natronoglomus mannanivorans TaxID=2979990 RepID=A0AAP2Z371_9EURY|nr:GNAT family N-acetyltransferase [Halobacteria archaeon AArc-xg1-1]
MLEIRSLTDDDLEDAMELSTQVGWNQIGADWERFLSLSPEGCFAGTVDGELVATTTVITYGDDVSWIGMVLVDEDHRSQGYGGQIFERGLEYARERGGDIVGLDATHLGEPIYQKYGFEGVATVFRWRGTLREHEPGSLECDERAPCVERLESRHVDTLCEFDRRHVGTDRSALFRKLLAEPDVRGYYASDSPDSSRLDGYAIARPGRTGWQIGPIVTADSSAIGPLLRTVSIELDGRDVIVDAPERDPVTSQLESIGLSRDRELVRMTYPTTEPALLTDSVRSFVDFAFG